MGKKKQTIAEELNEIEEMSRVARKKSEIWDDLRRRRELDRKIERVLCVLLGFVIGALAMYTSFPK